MPRYGYDDGKGKVFIVSISSLYRWNLSHYGTHITLPQIKFKYERNIQVNAKK